MQTWTSVNDEPVPFDCDVIICYRGWIRLNGAWKKDLVVCLARAWGVRLSGAGRVMQREYWRGKPSFFRWPGRELIGYSEITHWMPFVGFPAPPAGEKEA